MRPYYSHAGIEIFHADCREILPDFFMGIDLLLSDPPWGINYHTVRTYGDKSIKWKSQKFESPIVGDREPFDPSMLMRYSRAILWGANNFWELYT